MNAGRFSAHSRALRTLLEQVRRFAATDSNVLISGETGTGKNAVRDGRFRGDLFHRVGVLPIRLPPLREHPDDILPLATDFVRRAAAEARRKPVSLTRDASAALRDYSWPGNARELRHTIERAVQIAGSEPIALEHLPAAVLEAPALQPAGPLAHRPTLDEVERRYIAATLNHVRGSQTEAAKLLGISRKALWEKRKRYGLE